MGEYFAPVILHDDFSPGGYWYPHRFGTLITRETGGVEPVYIMGEGAKLMEHSYIGNPVPDAVCSWIRREPMRVGWVGDYTEEADVPLKGLVDAVHGDGKLAAYPWFREIPVPEHEVCEGAWLVNISRKQAVRIPEHEEGRWIPHPLPLLTSTDGYPTYHPRDEGCLDMVGTWKWDLLTVCDELPEGVEELDLEFPED